MKPRLLHCCISDLHHSLAIPTDSLKPRDEYRLLARPHTYHRFHRETVSYPGEDFWVHGLNPRDHDYFWDGLRKIQLPGKKESTKTKGKYWWTQLPLLFRPLTVALRAQVPEYELDVPVKVFALVWPVGWSFSLDFGFSFWSNLADLGDLNERLYHHSYPAYEFNGEMLTLSLVFRRLSKLLHGALYGDSQPRFDTVTVSRHEVMSIIDAERIPSPYADDGTGATFLSEADRAQLHRILLGRPVSVREVVAREKEDSFLLSRLIGTDFAITDYQPGRGTLLSLVSSYHKTPTEKKLRTLRCLTANIRYLKLQVFLLTTLLRLSADLGEHRMLQYLTLCARSTLRQLPGCYRNRFAASFYATYGPLLGAHDSGTSRPEGVATTECGVE